MRIWKRESDPWKRLRLVAKVCRYKNCVSESAAYARRCDSGHGNEPMNGAAKTEVSKARNRALSFFHLLLPDEAPSNFHRQTR